MSLSVKIECLPEPQLLFGCGETGADPRWTMTKAGAVDAAARDINLALVGPAETLHSLGGG
jgi:hypothetical protein